MSAPTRFTLALLLLSVITTWALNANAQQAEKPIHRSGLVQAIKINGLSTQELVAIIRRRGVDFQLTPDAEQELRSVGARPEVIAAVRESYRAAVEPNARAAKCAHDAARAHECRAACAGDWQLLRACHRQQRLHFAAKVEDRRSRCARDRAAAPRVLRLSDQAARQRHAQSDRRSALILSP